jgi:hypothetical protein
VRWGSNSDRRVRSATLDSSRDQLGEEPARGRSGRSRRQRSRSSGRIIAPAWLPAPGSACTACSRISRLLDERQLARQGRASSHKTPSACRSRTSTAGHRVARSTPAIRGPRSSPGTPPGRRSPGHLTHPHLRRWPHQPERSPSRSIPTSTARSTRSSSQSMSSSAKVRLSG